MEHETDQNRSQVPGPGSRDRRREPLVSVVMNCYNGERFLRETLDSLVAQTYGNWEVVFWDNASTDGSAAIARSYGDRIKYYRAPQTTPLGEARNLALQQVTGDYFTLLDTDDILMPHALERMVTAIENGDYAVCYAGMTQIDASGREIGGYVPQAAEGLLLDRLLRNFDIWLPSLLVRTSAVRVAGLSFDPKVTASEEYCLFMQLAVEHRYKVLPESVAYYRVHENALTNKSISKWADEREYTLARILERHPGIEGRHKAAFAEARARARYYRTKLYLYNGEKGKALREMSKTVLVSPIYAVLFALLLLPTPVWNWVHERRYKRARFG